MADVAPAARTCAARTRDGAYADTQRSNDAAARPRGGPSGPRPDGRQAAPRGLT